MIRNYIKIAWRNIIKNKSTFGINIIGLSTGIASFLMICLWVQDEWSFDKFHKNSDQLFQVMEVMNENGNVSVKDNTQGLLAETMLKDLPELHAATTFFSLVNEGYEFNITTPDNKIVKAGAIFADQSFFEMFTYPLIQGNASIVFAQKESAVISENLSKKIFGTTDNVLGKSIDCNIMGKNVLATVTGIIQDVPQNSTQKFDLALTKGTLFDMVPNFKEWHNEGTNTFLQLKEGTNIDAFNAKIKNFVHNYSKDTRFTLFVRPYADAYLYDTYQNGQQAGGRIWYVKLFSIIGLFILLIACINFVNLSTATASTRQKEIGIKKIVGSSRQNLIGQFLLESLFTIVLSLSIAIVLVFVLLPYFNTITSKTIAIHVDISTVMHMIAGVIVTTLLAGYYPAYYLSSLTPIGILKGKLKTSFSELVARKGLVVFQFTISLFLIVAVIAVYNQVQFIQNMNLGFDRTNVLLIDRDGQLMEKSQVFLDQLKELPQVQNASSLQGAIAQTGDNSNTSGLSWEGSDPKSDIVFAVKTVDHDLIETLDIKMGSGRSFSKDFGAENDNLIFNETAIKAMNITDPVGKKVNMWGKEKTIIGVVQDFFANSIHEKIKPVIFQYEPERTTQFAIRLAMGDEKSAIQKIQEIYSTINPGYPFRYTFMDQNYQQLYASEQRVSVLSRYFAGLAILISCLGLFGLALFNAKQRAKEIGVRKVLGASVTKIVLLLSKDFMYLSLIAICFAFPISWYAINKWLEGYAYKAEISVFVFIISIVCILVAILLTVSYQAIKAAKVNPIESLKNN